jgi:hypothetical protein
MVTGTRRQGGKVKMNQKFSISFQVTEANFIHTTPEDLEYYLKDLLTKSVLPALNLDLVYSSFEAKKARK